MIDRVRRYMEQWNMAAPGDTVYAAVSGGADSVCLCLILKELAHTMGFALRAVHVEHGIRGEESRRDAEFVRDFCGQQQILLTLRSVDVPAYARSQRLGTEEAARRLRYGVFAELSGEGCGCKVALAHQMEDNAETMLMALARGSGLDGLCGIPPVRRDGGVTYIRPLLSVSREAIERFLAERGQGFCTDSTNFETHYTRNYVRRELLPRLREVNPQAIVHMNRTAGQMIELRAFAEEETEAAFARVRVPSERAVRVTVAGLNVLSPALQTRVIRRAIGEAAGGKKDVGAVHVEAVRRLLSGQSGRRVMLPGGGAARREYGELVFENQTESPARAGAGQEPAGTPPVLEVSGQQLAALSESGDGLSVSFGEDGEALRLSLRTYEGKAEEISTKMYTKWFDYDMIKDGFSVRGRKCGDFFRMKNGHKKKLSDDFIDEKIPERERDQMRLIAAGQEVLWLIGGRMGCGAMVTERTKTVLVVSYVRESE